MDYTGNIISNSNNIIDITLRNNRITYMGSYWVKLVDFIENNKYMTLKLKYKIDGL